MSRLSVEAQLVELGKILVAARVERGQTQGELGDALGYTQPNISKMERGKTRIHPHLLDKWIDVLEIDSADAERMRRYNLAARADRVWNARRLAASPAWFHPVFEAEQEAAIVLKWTGERISGMLQTEDYMMEQFQAYGRTDVSDAVHERKLRAKLLDDYPDRTYKFILSESAVHRLTRARTDNPYVALGQVRHLLNLARTHPAATIRFVPFGNGPLHVGPDFTILQFVNSKLDRSFAETSNGVQTFMNDTETYDTDLQSWESLSSVALSAEESAILLEEAEADLISTRPNAVRGPGEPLR
ncbi:MULTISPECIES: Scr1 family TA system antitoxin-like transcriptional regulator [Amycolatopsis]|uniref:Helix-turn-helix transcriptional regulator n=1 Tax=Amycolatopsis dendrobii TaxID=2760662 RepID=A0A7W3VWG6_9PSEU|nr:MULTISPECIES: Scr1 family TA system antitoxin-like transcriptional regulator [Amycolatopsis]MBB1154375.1 helix-turn-helix transcriptional regulator [Amycolatopsis dendrobii]UKD51250.1 helix-turn-helix transcriptional regulator [Amycolatopsis sp. FU40]